MLADVAVVVLGDHLIYRSRPEKREMQSDGFVVIVGQPLREIGLANRIMGVSVVLVTKVLSF